MIALRTYTLFFALSGFGLMVLALPTFAQDNSDKLNSVKQRIAEQKSTILAVSQKRRELDKQLKRDDFAIAKVAKAINTTNKVLRVTRRKLTKLARQQKILDLAMQKQEKVLAIQVKSAYTSGQHDYVKMLLNQEDTSDVQKNVTYYQYLNKARIVEIEKFQSTMIKLEEIASAHEQQVDKLKSLQTQQKEQKVALEKNKEKRTQTLQALRKELLTNQQQLAKLEEEESELKEALQKLAALSKREINLNGLSSLKRKLAWPVKGKVRHSYGSKKQGYLKWKGVLLSSSIGTQVKSVHDGTILFADWLKGYGLVTVVDHGKGYMSLYGHNQTLLKNVGDKVESGEPIALVGQSGGQSQSGLYFEIRYRGQAVNPALYCK